MAASLNTLSEKINTTKKDVGNFTNNIGHYAEGAMSAFSQLGISVGGLAGPMKIASAASKGLGASLKALIANPVGAVIMAIVLAFKALKAVVDNVKEAINANEDSQMALSEAMSAFQPILDAISNAWDAVGQAVVKVIGFIGDAVRWLREAGAAVTDFLGITKGAKEQVKEQNELYKELAKSQNTLTKQKREYQKLNAKDQAEVERLREEASELENGKEKRRLLTEAKEKQAEIDARNVEIAKEELRILTEQSKLTANDAEMNDKLAAAEAKVSQETANAARNARTFNKALKGTTSGANEAAAAANKLAEEAKKVYEATVENNKDELTKLEEKYKKEKALLEKYGYDTTLLTKQYTENRQKIVLDGIKKESNKRIVAITEEQEYQKWLDKLKGNDKTMAQQELAALQSAQTAGRKLIKDFYATMKAEWKDGADDSLLPEMEEYIRDWVEKFNSATGLELKFPPESDEKPWSERYKAFKNNMMSLLTGLTLDIKKTQKIINGEIESSDTAKKLEDMAKRIRVSQSLFFEGDESKYRILTATYAGELLQTEKEYLEESLNNWTGDAEQKAEVRKRLFEIEEELAERRWEMERLNAERTEELWSSSFDAITNGADSINTILESIVSRREADIDAQVKEGKISEQTANKQKKALLSYQKTMQVVEIASVVANTAAGIMGIWKAYALEKVANAETAAAAGPAAVGVLTALNAKSLISAIAQTAGLAATGAAQIVSIRNGYLSTKASVEANNADSSAASASAVASPATIDSTPYSYTRTLQTEEEEDALNRPVWVSVVDIIDAENKAKVVNKESSF